MSRVRREGFEHESLSIILHFVQILLSVREFYEFCTPCRYFSLRFKDSGQGLAK